MRRTWSNLLSDRLQRPTGRWLNGSRQATPPNKRKPHWQQNALASPTCAKTGRVGSSSSTAASSGSASTGDEQLTRGLIELRSKYEQRLKDIKKSEHDSLPGEFVADITAVAGKVNEWTESLLAQLVVTIVDDVDRNARVAESIRQVSDAAFLEELAKLPIGKHTVTGAQKLQALQSYAAGHGLAALLATGGIGLSIVAAPIAIAAGVGLGGFMAFNTFRNQRQNAFTAEFRSWMNEEINRGQLAISSGYERAMIDVQERMREAMTAAFTEREKEINDAVAACQRSLKLAQTERQRDLQQLTAKLEEIRRVKRGGLALLNQANS